VQNISSRFGAKRGKKKEREDKTRERGKSVHFSFFLSRVLFFGVSSFSRQNLSR
jgi:hypothetical protein